MAESDDKGDPGPEKASTDDDASKDSAKPQDIVLLHSRTEDGEGIRALRSRAEKLELAEIRPMKPGKPLHGSGELVRLQQREESPLLYDVEVQHRMKSDGNADHAGPARVTSPKYRDNWESVFGKNTRKKSLPN